MTLPADVVLVLGGLLAGAFGAMLGLGGGILLVPFLTLGFGVPLVSAVGTSLLCVIATSAGAAAVNVRAGRADVRLGVSLGAGTALGALSGAAIAAFLPERAIAGLMAALLGYTAWTMAARLIRRRGSRYADAEASADPMAVGEREPAYRGRRRATALAGSFLGGNVSGLLGVGGGIITVPLMNVVMRAPLGVSVATSNFMIGITAAAGAYPYLFRGDVDPRLVAPVVLGVVAGAWLEARLGSRIPVSALRVAFVVVLGYVAVRMALRAGTGS